MTEIQEYENKGELILNFIKDYMKSNFNIRPTTREIATGIGLPETSTATVDHHINKLETAGLVRRYRGENGKIKSRNILIKDIDNF
ncbi:MAG: hypothetical protein AAF490_02950 [Chloroflexota bacterium]